MKNHVLAFLAMVSLLSVSLPVAMPAGPGGLDSPWGLTFGPDGNLYVSSFIDDAARRFDGTTGAFIDVFVGSDVEAGGLTFGPDGNLYVSSRGDDAVLRYDGATGGFVDAFASGGGLDRPFGLTFGPDGNLYVSSFNTNVVLRYDGTTGDFVDVFTVPEPSTGILLGFACLLCFLFRGANSQLRRCLSVCLSST